jgi:SAM-dependent methyltransferase
VSTSSEQIDGWRGVAAGWERRRGLFAQATTDLSERMVELLDPAPGQRILELAAGPGETGFRTLAKIQPKGELLVTDIAPEMVDAAKRRAVELGLENVRFGVEDMAELSLPDQSFDGVICRFGLMLVPEMDRAAGQIARVLRPGGKAVLAVWGSPERNPWMTATGRASVELGLVDPPDRDAPGPFRLSDPERLKSVIETAGLEVAQLEEADVSWEAVSVDEWWDASCDMSPTLGVLLAQLPAGGATELRSRAAAHLDEYLAADGSVTVPGLARIVVATSA